MPARARRVNAFENMVGSLLLIRVVVACPVRFVGVDGRKDWVPFNRRATKDCVIWWFCAGSDVCGFCT